MGQAPVAKPDYREGPRHWPERDFSNTLATPGEGVAHGAPVYSMAMRALPSARLLLIGLCVSLATLPALGQWKWRDARGQVQYSDRPPPSGTPDRDILQRPTAATIPRAALPVETAAAAAAAAAPAAAASAVDPALEAKRKQAEAEEKAKLKAEEDRALHAKAQNCERARAALRTLDSGQRMVRINAQGEREVIDDVTRASEANQARQAAADNCS